MAQMVYKIATHSTYNEFAKQSIKKLADTHLKLHHICTKDKLNSMQIHNICKSHSKAHWCSFLDAILKHHRSQFKDDYIPRVLPSGSRLVAADLIDKKYDRQVKILLENMKKREAKLHTQVRATVKKRR